MPTAPATSYDRVPYKSHPFRQSHPDRLAVIATLHGMSPPPIERARVLELGCASGGNLLPIADQFPEGTFLGLDLSSRQIQDGQRLIERAGLKNVELRHQDILQFDAPPDCLLDYFAWIADSNASRFSRHATEPVASDGSSSVIVGSWRSMPAQEPKLPGVG